MHIRIDNWYGDGHESLLFLNVNDDRIPTDESAMWEYLFQFTGDGHGTYYRTARIYMVTILGSTDRPELVGFKRTWD